MSLIENVIPVKGRFVKETRGYREADVQLFIRQVQDSLCFCKTLDRSPDVKCKICSVLNKFAGPALVLEVKQDG